MMTKCLSTDNFQMNCFFKSVFLFLLLLQFSALDAQNRADSIRKRIETLDTTSVLVVAHRGDWRYASENSMLAIEHAIKLGVDIIEIDIQRTKDGHLVLLHDDTLDRTTTGEGKVDEITLDSLKNLRLRNGIGIATSESVPTLEEVLRKTKGQVLFNLDKADKHINDVFRLLKKTGTTQYIIMKTAMPFVDARIQFHDYLRHTFLMPIINLDLVYAESEVDAYMSFLKPKLVEFVYSDSASVKPFRMRDRLEGKTMLWYNTMWSTLSGGHDDDLAIKDARAAYGYLIDVLGANIIQTDRPEYLLEYLRKRKLHD